MTEQVYPSPAKDTGTPTLFRFTHNKTISNISIQVLDHIVFTVAEYGGYLRSASGIMMRGLLPPSSRDTRFRLLLAAASIIRRPTWYTNTHMSENHHLEKRLISIQFIAK